MLIDHWPLFGLRARTARLELRLPAEEELAQLAGGAATRLTALPGACSGRYLPGVRSLDAYPRAAEFLARHLG